MIIDLFKIPVFINNIDIKKIKLNNKQFKRTWPSETLSTYDQAVSQKTEMDKESVLYLSKKIVSILEEKIKYPFTVKLKDIWENYYLNNDYQEPHLHEDSDFSFIIYKDVKESETIFLNPIKNYLLFYPNIKHIFDSTFKPECKNGQIIIFPSFLEHMVLKSSKQKTIAGNIHFQKI
tara:strand:- start:1013 stop:1543 length:531 start_codon:yes stop_codon:yes gene_type:complete